jgi:hypothetical protein
MNASLAFVSNIQLSIRLAIFSKTQKSPRNSRLDQSASYARVPLSGNIHGTVTTTPQRLPELPFPNGYNPGEQFSWIALNCVGEAKVENISFDNIHLKFGGGGTVEHGARRDLPEIAGEYFHLGPMPAYGIYARNASGPDPEQRAL